MKQEEPSGLPGPEEEGGGGGGGGGGAHGEEVQEEKEDHGHMADGEEDCELTKDLGEEEEEEEDEEEEEEEEESGGNQEGRSTPTGSANGRSESKPYSSVTHKCEVRGIPPIPDTWM